MVTGLTRGAEFLRPGSLRVAEFLQRGLTSGAEFLQPRSLRGAEFLQPGSLRGAEFLQPRSLRGAEFLQPGLTRGAEFLQPCLYGDKKLDSEFGTSVFVITVVFIMKENVLRNHVLFI